LPGLEEEEEIFIFPETFLTTKRISFFCRKIFFSQVSPLEQKERFFSSSSEK
jgi:hypothetical protein